MSMQQAVPPRSAANGHGRRRGEREIGTRLENKSQSSRTNPSKLTNAGVLTDSKGGGCESPSRERLVYLTTSLIGLPVEVQVKDGSFFSGIFHATNAEQDFGIILKMARSIPAGSSRGQKVMFDSVSKAPSKSLIISAKELVQIIAKEVSITRDGLANEFQHIQPQDIMIDSSISESRHVEGERELERWVPDDDSQCPELENIFDGRCNRGWDQFEVNKSLFGVKSTFDEELYTTKLERGPQTRELEREASRIAREIEGEDTQDLHLAEERGIHLHGNFDVDEETKYSSVFRGVDDSGYDESEDILLGSDNTETFGVASGSVVSRSFTDITSGRTNDGAQVSSTYSSMDEMQSSQSSTGWDLFQSGSNDHASHLSSEPLSKNFSPLDDKISVQENQLGELEAGKDYTKEHVEKLMPGDEALKLKSVDSESSVRSKKQGFNTLRVSPSKGQDKMTPSDVSEDPPIAKSQGATQPVNSRGQPGNSTPSTSDGGGSASASGGRGLSPSSSMGSLSSEKSTLNPHAKEFKFNPNAKSFAPSQAPLRPASPVPEGAFYFPQNVAPVPHMHGMPMGMGIGPSFPGQQPVVMYNPQAAPMQSPQAYFHPNGPQYGQPMILGHPRNVVYMPAYPPPDMPYNRREF